MSIILGFCSLGYARQTNNSSEDSLLKVLEISPERLKSRIYLQLSELALNYDTSLSKSYALDALDLSVKNEVTRDKAESMYLLGYIYFHQDSLELSHDYFDYFLNTAEKLGNKEIADYKIAETIGYAHYYRAKNNLKSGSDSLKQIINDLNKALFALEKSEDYNVLASIYIELGKQYIDVDALEKGINNMQMALNLYNKMGEHKKVADIYSKLSYFMGRAKSVDYCQEAVKHYSLAGDSAGMARHMINMAYMSAEVLGAEKSIEYFKTALEINKKCKNVNGIVYACFHIGNFYYQRLQDYNNARYYYSYGIKAGKNNKTTSDYGHILISMGNFYMNTDKPDSAQMYFTIADSVTSFVESSSSRIRYFYTYGKFLMRSGKLNDSERVLKKALQLAKKKDDAYLAKNTYSYLHKLYILMGSFEKALYNYKESIYLKDSFFNARNQKLIAQNQIKYETEKTEHELQLMQKNDEIKTAELKKKQVYIISLCLCYAKLFNVMQVFRQGMVLLKRK